MTLRAAKTDSAVSRGRTQDQVVTVPVAPGEGNVTAEAETLARLEGAGRVVLNHCDVKGIVGAATDVSGPTNGIAGLPNDRAAIPA